MNIQETKSQVPQVEVGERKGKVKKTLRNIGAWAALLLTPGGAGAAASQIDNTHSSHLSGGEIHGPITPGKEQAKYEGVDDKNLVAAEQEQSRQKLDEAAKSEALGVIDELRHPAMGAEGNNVGTGPQNKSSHLEGTIPEATNSTFVNYDAESGTLHVSDMSDKGASDLEFSISAETVQQLNSQRQQKGEVNLDNLQKAVQDKNTHVRHFGVVDGTWDVRKNDGVSLRVTKSGEIRQPLATDDYYFNTSESQPTDTLASPTDVSNFVKLAGKVHDSKKV